ncbi:hypothetical protein TKK_0001361 [Trichogramma kaykai]
MIEPSVLAGSYGTGKSDIPAPYETGQNDPLETIYEEEPTLDNKNHRHNSETLSQEPEGPEDPGNTQDFDNSENPEIPEDPENLGKPEDPKGPGNTEDFENSENTEIPENPEVPEEPKIRERAFIEYTNHGTKRSLDSACIKHNNGNT